MASVLDLLATLSLDKSNYDKGLKNAESDAGSVGSNIASTFVQGGKLIAKGMAAATAAVGAFAVASVKGYSDYEQLVGGVQKLYGDAANELMSYANQAYKTAGMSANQYMEQATSFSASLINSLGGDVSKAAKQTDVAMRAISDNVNTFGSDVQSVSYAFQGFAKQNYTMLDNLKLGYGGTKSEMERLIADANEYAKSIGQASDLSIDSFSDVVTAIELIQEKQGIAGTTTKEAASTIEGSINMLKASWQDLITGMSNSDADLTALMNNVVDSAKSVVQNVTPVLEKALEGVGTFVSEGLPMVLNQLPSLLNSLLPSLLNSAASLIQTVTSNLPSLIMQGIETIQTLFTSFDFVGFFTGLLDSIMEGISSLAESLGGSIAEGLPDFLDSLLETLLTLVEELMSNAGELVDIGINLMLQLTQGIMDSLPTLIEHIPLIIDSIATAINDNAPKLLVGGLQMLLIIAKGLIEAVPALLSNLDTILKTIIDVIFAINWLNFGKDIITFIGDGFRQLASHLPQAASDIFESVKNVITNTNWLELGKNVIIKIGQGLKNLATHLPDIIRSIFNSAVSTIKNINWIDIGKNVIQGIVNGLKSAGGQIKEFLLGLMKGAVDSVKKFFGIHSPSRLMRDEIGKFIPMGMALGIDDESDKVTDAMEELQQIPEQTNVDLGSVDINGEPINVSKQLVTSDLIKQQDANNSDVTSKLEQLINLLSEYLPQAINTSVVLDTGALVGQIAPSMDSELGRLADKNLRGVY